jgi:hypothetical protein
MSMKVIPPDTGVIIRSSNEEEAELFSDGIKEVMSSVGMHFIDENDIIVIVMGPNQQGSPCIPVVISKSGSNASILHAVKHVAEMTIGIMVSDGELDTSALQDLIHDSAKPLTLESGGQYI